MKTRAKGRSVKTLVRFLVWSKRSPRCWSLNAASVVEAVTFPLHRVLIKEWKSTNSQVTLGYRQGFGIQTFSKLQVNGNVWDEGCGAGWEPCGCLFWFFFLSFKYKSLNGHSSVLNPSPHVTRKQAEVNKAELLSSRGRDQHGESFMYIFTRCCYDDKNHKITEKKRKEKASL